MNIDELKAKIETLDKSDLLKLKEFLVKELDKKNKVAKYKNYDICMVCWDKVDKHKV